MTYQERLRALREDNDLTQTQIATILCMPQTTHPQNDLDKLPILI